MHIVFVTSLVPVAEPRSGYDIANRVIVDALRALGHRVSVLGFLQPGNTPAEAAHTRVLRELEVTNARVGRGRKLAWLSRALLRGEPVSVTKMHAVSQKDVAAALAAFGPYDLLFLNSVQLPGAFLDLFTARPYLFVAHNVEARSARDNASTASSPLRALLFRREARLLAALESRLCRDAGFVFTLADADRPVLGVDSETRSATLPLVTAIEPPPAPSPRQPRYDVGLIGSWSWAANRAGLDWFLTEIAPRLPADFSIAIAGDLEDRPASIPANVQFLGRVPDAREFVRSARVIPLISRLGTGVQLKTIETFEMGLPSVATANALRGLTTRPDNCTVSDDPAAFAAALVHTVTQARDNSIDDRDGRAFHQRQLDGLLAALRTGIERVAARAERSEKPKEEPREDHAESAPPDMLNKE
ncbi:glycosyltransferase [Pseudohoeflea coraliihabitans]|uniref:Glycosyltransferase family 4 protein n=1 Tax=Pseudohoeflea coraliihabitans TaxID=2860393 RepID=A0ABS6WPU8_9HYPH|nr:glycosyltransferase family 4 protein [Pseudohoeflea sp. DP4N28-3]MBW3098001.1 glycosyltransferase family 4 protein [Pseudohoeflea sp. DP4N28-3]